MRAQILSYSRARGVFAGVSLNGMTFRQDGDANQRFYGTRLGTPQIVFDNLVAPPAAAAAWQDALLKFAS
jgi:lipid-binding SYLF domain-containing protein